MVLLWGDQSSHQPRIYSKISFTDTCPPNTVGYCCEVTCMVGDERWKSGERLTDWILDDLVGWNAEG